MKNHIDLEEGTFYSMGDGFIVLKEPVQPCTFIIGEEVKITSMFTIFEVSTDTKPSVGFFFYTALKVRNGGGFLLTFMQSKRGKAKECSLSLRSEHLMVYDYPGCGSLAITTKVNDPMMSILMEQ